MDQEAKTQNFNKASKFDTVRMVNIDIFWFLFQCCTTWILYREQKQHFLLVVKRDYSRYSPRKNSGANQHALGVKPVSEAKYQTW